MNAIGDKLLKAAEKTGNKQMVQSVKKAERAEAQRKEAKQKARKEGKTFTPPSKGSHGVTKGAVKAATGGKTVGKKPAPKKVQNASVAGKQVSPKTKLAGAALKIPAGSSEKATLVQKPKDTLTEKGVAKLAEKSKGKPKQHQKPQGQKPAVKQASKPQAKPAAKKTAPTPKAEGSSISHSTYMEQMRNSVKSGSGL